MAKLGKYLAGQATFGYEWKDHKLVPNPKESPVRKLIYELFSEHKRKKTVARFLNDAGYRTRSGAKFSDTTIGRLLRDPTPKGVPFRIEPIVTKELWEECNRILDEQDKTNMRPARKVVNLFSGLALCSCDSLMYVPSNSPKYVCKNCRNKIGINDLEELFRHRLKYLTELPKAISNLLNDDEPVIREKKYLLNGLLEEQKRVKRKDDKLFQLYDEGEISKESFSDRHKPLEQILEQIVRQIPELQAELDLLRIKGLSDHQIVESPIDLYEFWPQLGHDKKRKIIEATIQSIIVGKGDITINFSSIK